MAIIGVSKPYYGVYSASGNNVTYASGGVLGKLKEINLDIETSEDNNLYADNAVAETDRTFANGTLTLTPDDLSQEVSKAILGLREQALDSSIPGVTDSDVKELIYDDTQVTPYLGVGFIVKKKSGVIRWPLVWLAAHVDRSPKLHGHGGGGGLPEPERHGRAGGHVNPDHTLPPSADGPRSSAQCRTPGTYPPGW